jgi:oxaloacetate decarboxylase gamma subunit
MEANLVVEGLKFMALGMGTVFTFLVIMIGFMKLQAKIIHKCFPEPNENTSVPLPQQTQQSKTNKVAAIVAAIFEDKKNS